MDNDEIKITMLKRVEDYAGISDKEKDSNTSDDYIITAEYRDKDSSNPMIEISAIARIENVNDRMFIVFTCDTHADFRSLWAIPTTKSVVEERAEVKNDIIRLFNKEDIIEYMITKEKIFYPCIIKSLQSYQTLKEKNKKLKELKEKDRVYQYQLM